MERQKPAKQRGGGLQKGSPSPPWWYVRGGGRLAQVGDVLLGPNFIQRFYFGIFQFIPVFSGIYSNYSGKFLLERTWKYDSSYCISPPFYNIVGFLSSFTSFTTKNPKKNTLINLGTYRCQKILKLLLKIYNNIEILCQGYHV